MKRREIEHFVALVSGKTDFAHVHNFYSESPYKQDNLKHYLIDMLKLKPKYVLVGEAPGYKGCRETGIPFTSEAIMRSKTKRTELFRRSQRYQVKGHQPEPTATIIWKQLDRIDTLPLLWNCFPLHPYQSGKLNTNRYPLAGEKKWGAEILQQLLEIFPSVRYVISVGNHARDQVQDLHFKCTKDHLRHPSRGGKPAFVAGFERIFSQCLIRMDH